MLMTSSMFLTLQHTEPMSGVHCAGADDDLYLYAVTHAQTAVFNMTIASKVSLSALQSLQF